MPTCSMRARFEAMIRDAQDSICAAIEEVDGTKFRQDAWTRPAGGGGITRVIQVGRRAGRPAGRQAGRGTLVCIPG
jgi:coproporphyrinogen III oxidase